jgi:monovalent cation:H+ antiporter-2, CPA2 family
VVVPETLEASLQLSAFVLGALGLDAHSVDLVVDRERSLFAASLEAQAGL